MSLEKYINNSKCENCSIYNDHSFCEKCKDVLCICSNKCLSCSDATMASAVLEDMKEIYNKFIKNNKYCYKCEKHILFPYDQNIASVLTCYKYEVNSVFFCDTVNVNVLLCYQCKNIMFIPCDSCGNVGMNNIMDFIDGKFKSDPIMTLCKMIHIMKNN